MFFIGDRLSLIEIRSGVLDYPCRFGHLIFGRRFALLEMLLPLKIKLLSLRISVEWLNVFVLLPLTDICHVGEEHFEDYPHSDIRVLIR